MNEHGARLQHHSLENVNVLLFLRYVGNLWQRVDPNVRITAMTLLKGKINIEHPLTLAETALLAINVDSLRNEYRNANIILE